jgi:prephenate dehydrogenase
LSRIRPRPRHAPFLSPPAETGHGRGDQRHVRTASVKPEQLGFPHAAHVVEIPRCLDSPLDTNPGFCVPAPMPVLPQLTILAPGLLGGSVAQAARMHGAAERIVLWARRPEVRLALRGQPWCDAVADTPEEAVREAGFVVIAAPVDCIAALARQIAPALPAGAIVTDVGSVKGEIARLGAAALGPRAHFVGSHPMAGSEKTGWEHGTARLFEHRTCFVTPLPASPASAVDTVAGFWRSLGAEVVTLDADAHDEIVAHISHLPQVVATSLCSFLAQKNPAWRNYAGGGLRDTTRLAGSDAHLWRSILEQNRDEVLRALRQFEEELHQFQIALSNRDWMDVVARLQRGKAYRDQFRPLP